MLTRRDFLKGTLVLPAVALYSYPKSTVVKLEGSAETRVQTLARWHSSLNGWEWPEDLPGKPDDFDSLPTCIWEAKPSERIDRQARSKFTVVDPIIEQIEALIGDKECLRWHHLHNLDRTNAEFETWWAGKGYGSFNRGANMNSSTVADQQLIDTIYQLYQEVRELKERVAILENKLSVTHTIYGPTVEIDEEHFNRLVEKALYSIPVSRMASGTIGAMLSDEP